MKVLMEELTKLYLAFWHPSLTKSKYSPRGIYI